MKPVPFLDLSGQSRAIGAEVRAAVDEVFAANQFVLKDRNARLESEIARRLSVKHAIGVASGSDALFLALVALGVKPGDEVIVPSFTFFATAGAVTRAGAVPVFADIEENTFSLDAASVRKKISPKTRAVIPVHLYGLPADVSAAHAAVSGKNVAVIEDAAQSFGAQFDGRPAGGLGDAGCLSFYPTKNLGGAGDGGMVVTNSDAVDDAVRLLRVHGARRQYHHEVVGFNSRLDELQAAVLLVKLKYVERWNERRRAIAALYDRELEGLPLARPVSPPNARHVYHLYTIRTGRRDELAAFLEKEGIGTGVYYPIPLHLQACYRSLGYHEGDLPAAESACQSVLSLPMFPELTDDEVRRVAASLRKFFKK